MKYIINGINSWSTLIEFTIIILVILFQPEIRKRIEKIRRSRKWISTTNKATFKSPSTIKNILTAVENLSKNKIGALIVFEFQESLDRYIESGIPIRAKITAELMLSLFSPGTPTHDGAIVIRDNQIAAAGCLLPLTESKVLDKRLGTRHRSAIGLSEITDAIIIIISEETGAISLAEDGKINRFLNREAIETRLFSIYSEKPDSGQAPKERFGLFKKKK